MKFRVLTYKRVGDETIGDALTAPQYLMLEEALHVADAIIELLGNLVIGTRFFVVVDELFTGTEHRRTKV